MSGFHTIRYAKSGATATVTLDRPQVVNAYNLAMRDELFQVLEAVRDDPDVRGVILNGAGPKGFCAGADLTEFGTAPSQAVARWTRWERDVWGMMENMPKPMVAAIHGYCLGSGLEMACLCDFRVASESAVFGLPEVQLGMVPGAGGTQTLSRVVGPGRALELLLTGRRLNAQEALDMGLVSQVVPEASLSRQAEALLHSLLEHPSRAVEALKATINRGLDMPLPHALRMEYQRAVSLAHAAFS